MKIRTAFIITAVIFSFTAGHAIAKMEMPVETQRGKMLTIGDLEFGHIQFVSKGREIQIGVDTHGNPIYRQEDNKSNFFETDNIPLIIGDAFGFSFRLPEIRENDEIAIRAVLQLPRSIKKGNEFSDKLEGEIRYDSRFSGQVRRISQNFRKEGPEYHMTGIWQLSLYNKGELIISHRFNIQK